MTTELFCKKFVHSAMYIICSRKNINLNVDLIPVGSLIGQNCVFCLTFWRRRSTARYLIHLNWKLKTHHKVFIMTRTSLFFFWFFYLLYIYQIIAHHVFGHYTISTHSYKLFYKMIHSILAPSFSMCRKSICMYDTIICVMRTKNKYSLSNNKS